MQTVMRRKTRRRKGLGPWRLVRYTDDFVVIVAGSRANAEALQNEGEPRWHRGLTPLGDEDTGGQPRGSLRFPGLPHPVEAPARLRTAVRLHLPFAVSHSLRSEQGGRAHPSVITSRAQVPGAAPRRSAAGMMCLLPGWRVRATVQQARFTSWAFTRRAIDSGLLPSMGSVGCCFDNAVIESFWSRMRSTCSIASGGRRRVDLANAIFEYLEIYDNRRRRHSSLGMLTPVEFEARGQPTPVA